MLSFIRSGTSFNFFILCCHSVNVKHKMIFQHNQPNNILTWSNASLLKAWYSRYDHYTTLLCSMSALNCFIIIEIDTPKLSLLLQTSTDLISVLCVSVKLVLGWQRTLKQTCWWHCPGPGNDPSRHGGVERWSRCDNNAMQSWTGADWRWLWLTAWAGLGYWMDLLSADPGRIRQAWVLRPCGEITLVLLFALSPVYWITLFSFFVTTTPMGCVRFN